jgi:hypothetical protein
MGETVRTRLERLERQADAKGGRILVIRDDHGHEIWPLGWRKGADVQEIKIGGLDIEKDL